jgi:hypothetical protein
LISIFIQADKNILCALSCFQARKFYQLYSENTSERLNCNIEAISASDNSTAVGFITQAKYLSTTGDKLLQSITATLVS